MKYKYIFGPVPSRRLGVSLGIDLIPLKTCCLDCVYCECGRTTNKTIERKEYVPTQEVIDEVRDFVENSGIELDYITFAGSGEPMLHSKIKDIITEIKKISDTKIALITNGIMFADEKAIDEVLECDLIMPSLDAVSKDVFDKMNRPHKDIEIDKVIAGLIKLRKKYTKVINLEIFIIDGLNNTKSELDKLKDIIKKINPDMVQLNSLDRPPVENWVDTISIEKLQEIIDYWEMDNVEIVKKYRSRRAIRDYNEKYEEVILNMLGKRPCTLEDISSISGLKIVEINKYMDVLEKEEKIQTYIGERGVFIRLV